LESKFMVAYIPKKDLLSKTSGPPMRVNVIKISRKENEVEEVTNPLALGKS